jgi:hypothetical protein
MEGVSRMRKVALELILVALVVLPVWAQQTSGNPQSAGPESAAVEQRIKDLEERIIALEGQVRLLKSESAAQQPAGPGAQPAAGAAPVPVQEQAQTQAPQAATPAQIPSVGTATTAGQLPVYGGASAAAKVLNPDISVIGDFIGAAGQAPSLPLATMQPFPSLQMHESELGLQAIIDPYARGDFFISFGEQGVNLEEGFITFTALPAGFVAKVGKMRSAFGKVNMMHNHVLPWVDRPFVTNNLVGGEDGIDDAGVSIERILPAPKGIFLEATGQLFRGDSDDVFHANTRGDLSTVEHLRGYKDITESTNLDLGISYARGHSAPTIPIATGLFVNDVGPDSITQLYGLDATLRWKPLRRSIYHSFIGRTELIWSQRQQLPREQRSFGFYTSADYQFARRWFLGGRFDRSGRSRFENLTDQGGSVTLTYWPSEFSQIRGQYRLTHYAENITANELLMQVIFSLGAHGAHPF